MANKNVKSSKKNDIANRVQEVVNAYVSKENLETDPNGSYTGKALNKFEKPIQDADDL